MTVERTPLLQVIDGPLVERAWDDDDRAVVFGSDKGAGLAPSGGYLPADASTGQVARTVAAAIGDFASVKNLGAVGDGVTDDYAALAAAVARSVPLHFPAGTYLISQELNITNCPSIRGDGKSSIIKATAGFNVNSGPSSGTAALLRAGGSTTFGDWWDEGTLEHIKLDGSGLAIYGLNAINTRFANLHGVRVINTALAAFYVWAGYGMRAYGCFAHSGNYPTAADDVAALWIKGSDHRFTGFEGVKYPIGVLLDSNAAGSHLYDVHVWSTYTSTDVGMRHGFLIKGEGNSLVNCFADSPRRLTAGSANSLANGGYGFHMVTNAFKSRLICPIVQMNNTGDVAPATGTIQPIYIANDKCMVLFHQFKSSLGGVAFASPDISYHASVSYQSDVFGSNSFDLGSFRTAFTPVLNFGGATTGITYANAVGWVWKISGDLFRFYLFINLSSKGSATGTATITGLPLTSKDIDTNSVQPMTSVHVASLGAATSVYATLANNSSTLTLRSFTTQSALTDTTFGNSTKISITGEFQDNSR
jgi:hypothetical protein